ncbi:MAG: hypothetical protein N7Q72_02320, partial [Spiroplasma sp. Tabriz.8]|nr:hypothetical protein [Spiroplasma sp. Tabriz.8]
MYLPQISGYSHVYKCFNMYVKNNVKYIYIYIYINNKDPILAYRIVSSRDGISLNTSELLLTISWFTLYNDLF